MASQILAMSVVVLFLLLPPLQDSNPQKPLYRQTGQEATLVGTVTVNGNTEPPKRIDMFADPICMELSPHGLTEFVVRNGDKLQNVFVYFKSGNRLDEYGFEQPNAPAKLQRKNCFYIPRALGIRVNQPLHIENNDPTHHNVHPTPKLNVEWNQTHAPGSAPLVKTFSRPEVAIPFKCNHHPWEKAWVGVFKHPFFSITDMFGRYEIRSVPPGTYKLAGWHERFGEQEVEITLVPGEIRNVDFVFAAKVQ